MRSSGDERDHMPRKERRGRGEKRGGEWGRGILGEGERRT
jgi:hypothetical protein